jgi:hypothetical protein
VLRELFHRLSRRPPAAPDFRAIPLPPRERDDGRELVVTRPDGTRLHLPSRATRDVMPESINRGQPAIDQPRPAPLFRASGSRQDGTAGRTP